MRVGFVVHPARERAVEAAGKLVAWCRERGLVTRSLAEADVGADESLAPGSFVADLALVVLEGQVYGGRAVPLSLNDRDGSVREDAGHARARRQIFEPCHPVPQSRSSTLTSRSM